MEFNCRKFLSFVILLLLAEADGALAGTIAPSQSPTGDILNPAAGPCDPSLNSPDYVEDTDVNGQPVASADLPAKTTGVPDVGPVIVERHQGGHDGQAVSMEVDPAAVIQNVASAHSCEPVPRSSSPH